MGDRGSLTTFALSSFRLYVLYYTLQLCDLEVVRLPGPTDRKKRKHPDRAIGVFFCYTVRLEIGSKLILLFLNLQLQRIHPLLFLSSPLQ